MSPCIFEKIVRFGSVTFFFQKSLMIFLLNQIPSISLTNYFIFVILARQMVICVRLALQEGAVGDWAKLFNGYIVTLLVIFYLQIAGKLPSVLSLQSDPKLELVKCGGSFAHTLKYIQRIFDLSSFEIFGFQKIK